LTPQPLQRIGPTVCFGAFGAIDPWPLHGTHGHGGWREESSRTTGPQCHALHHATASRPDQLRTVVHRLCTSQLTLHVVWVPSHLQPADPLSRVQSLHSSHISKATRQAATIWSKLTQSLDQVKPYGVVFVPSQPWSPLCPCEFSPPPILFAVPTEGQPVCKFFSMSLVHPGAISVEVHKSRKEA
jgi:hypothetical protein